MRLVSEAEIKIELNIKMCNSMQWDEPDGICETCQDVSAEPFEEVERGAFLGRNIAIIISEHNFCLHA